MLKFNRILLITSPISEGRNRMPFYPSISLGYIAEILKHNSIEYDIVDMYLGYDYNYLSKKIKSFKPDLLGIRMFTHQYSNGYNLLREIKDDFPDLNIIAGGPHLSNLRECVLKDCAEIDYGVVLEGEETIIELCQGKELDSIKGLLYRKDKEILYTGDRAFIEDLDSIPFPRFEKFELSKYLEKKIPIITSRGCPYSCTYCPVTVTIGKKFRARSPQNIIKEIQFWYERGYKLFAFLDDNFTLDLKRVYELCDLIESSKMKDLNLSCPNGIRADKVNRDLLKRMRVIGFRELAFGVEVGNDKMLKLIKKGEKMEQIERAIKDACDLDFRVSLFFIIGSPGETWKDFEDSLALAQKYPIFALRFYHIIPFPKTELYSYLEKNNYFLVQPEEYLNSASSMMNNPVFITAELSEEERKKAFILGEKLLKEIFRNYLYHRLKNYGFITYGFIRILPLDFILNLYWNNRLFRNILGRLRNYF